MFHTRQAAAKEPARGSWAGGMSHAAGPQDYRQSYHDHGVAPAMPILVHACNCIIARLCRSVLVISYPIVSLSADTQMPP